jgi:hypothetical protein
MIPPLPTEAPAQHEHPPHRAVYIFEICTAVFENLHDDGRCLCDVRLTCRAWAAVVDRVQWRAPAFSDLLRPLAAARVADYGRAVRRVELREPDVKAGPQKVLEAADGALRHWYCPDLRDIVVDVATTTALAGAQALLQCAGRRVLSVSIRPLNHANPARMFRSYAEMAYRDDDVAYVPADLLATMRALGRQPLLASLTVDLHLSSALLRLLAAVDDDSDVLESERIAVSDPRGSTTLSGSESNSISSSRAQIAPFSRLAVLNTAVFPRTLPALVSSPLAAAISRLDLLVLRPHYPEDQCSTIHSLRPLSHQLTALALTFLRDEALLLPDIEALHAFSRLTMLRLMSKADSERSYVFPASFTGAGLARIMSRLPHLSSLDLRCTNLNRPNTVQVIGEACRHLEHLYLDNAQLCASLGSCLKRKELVGQPLFPKLKSLVLLTLGGDDREDRYVL